MKIETAIHIIFVLIGLLLLVVAGFLTEPLSAFWIPLLINFGSSFIVIAAVFVVTSALRDEQSSASIDPQSYPQRELSPRRRRSPTASGNEDYEDYETNRRRAALRDSASPQNPEGRRSRSNRYEQRGR